MFLHLCVILFRGVSVKACITGHMTGGLCPGCSLSRAFSVQGGLCPRSLCPGCSLGVSVTEVSVQGVAVYGGFCPGWYLSKGGLSLGGALSGVSVQGVLCPGKCLCPVGSLSGRPPGTVTSGRYASYRNAFLFSRKWVGSEVVLMPPESATGYHNIHNVLM